MVTLTVTLRVRPGHLEAFLAAIAENADRSFADEPGCLYFDVSRDQVDDHRFFFHEVYIDDDAVSAHRAAPHFTTWRAAADLYVEPGTQVNVLADRLFHYS